MKKIVWLICLLLLSACSLSPDETPDPVSIVPATPTPVPTMTATPPPGATELPSPTAIVTIPPSPTTTEADLIHLRPAPPTATATATATATRLISIPAPTSTRPAGLETHVPILMFHHVAVPPANADGIRLDLTVWPEPFEALLASFVKLGYHTVSIEEVYNAVTKGAKLPGKPIVLTFDDAYDDSFTVVLPLLKKYGFTGTFYVPSGLVEQPGYMTWAQVVQLSEAGMEIQSHTISHPMLKGKSADFVRRELTVSKRSLEMMIGKPVLFFCYPSGQYDAQTIQILKESGYLSATTTEAGAWQNAGLPYEWPRVRVHGGRTAPEMLKRIRDFVGAPY